MPKQWIPILVLVLSSLGIGCAEAPPDGTPVSVCGAVGQLGEHATVGPYCSYGKVTGAVQETGFLCPEGMPYFFETPEEFICAGSEEGLPEWTPSELPGEEPPSTGPPLDILFVIDNSVSMCREQSVLAGGLNAFLAALEGIDYRVAVTTTDTLTEGALAGPAQGTSGQFHTQSVSAFPFACAEKEVMSCGEGACDSLEGDWACDKPESPEMESNCNGSLNSHCRLRCSTDEQCDAALLGAASGEACLENPESCQYRCLSPSGNPDNSACVIRPPTTACPETLPAFMTAENAAELLPCAVVVGAEQTTNTNLEQGLSAAFLSLDPAGPNAAQAAAFLRAEAALLVVFVTDEDDCSVAEGQSLSVEEYATCSCAGSVSEGGVLADVSSLVANIQGLKSNPERVYTAAVIGDSLATEADAISIDRAAYSASKCGVCEDPAQVHPLLSSTTICSSGGQSADFGARYVDFVQAFGARGTLANICALEELADTLGNVASQVVSSLQP